MAAGGVVEYFQQGAEIVGRGFAQGQGMVKQEHVARGRQPGKVAQAVGKRVPVVAGLRRELERGRDCVDQGVFVMMNLRDEEAKDRRQNARSSACGMVRVTGGIVRGRRPQF